jgi:hypothetical protein
MSGVKRSASDDQKISLTLAISNQTQEMAERGHPDEASEIDMVFRTVFGG